VAAPDKVRIDTRLDLPVQYSGRLTEIAANLVDAEGRSIGFLNPFSHAALSDALTMLKIMDIHPIEAVLARAAIPNILVQAVVNFETNGLAKARGYYAHYENGKFKAWLKTIKENEVEKEQKDAGFKVVVWKE
jgi:hypothetical protein